MTNDPERSTDNAAFTEEYRKLNAKQRAAVDAIEGPVLVVAGPGSGKTQILALRVGNILEQTDVLPSNILCLTFTDSAATNMRERLTELIGRDAYRVAIHTFHNFGVEIIDRYPEYFFNNAVFSPADELIQVEVLSGLLEAAEYDNPLKKEHPEQGYTYLHSIRTAISHLKKAGLSPAEFRSALEANRAALDQLINPLVDELFGGTVNKGMLEKIGKKVAELRDQAQSQNQADHSLPPAIRPLASVVADSLERALREAAAEEKTRPLSVWKQRWTEKAEDGSRVLKDTHRLERLSALADIYEQYREEMYRRGYYDFDDMLLHTIQAVENNSRLRSNLQEQYQYVLVDEFQDTNDAQMRLLYDLLDAPVHEGRPNIMAVGDDDQAIYKFQGAEISNILNFRERYRDPAVITLTENYRSAQDILDIARFIISKGEDRLERRLPEIEKTLTAAGELKHSDINRRTFPTRSHEYSWVAREIERLRRSGVPADEIAVIARQHKHLQELLPYLYREAIPVRYERQQNVLTEPHIHQLIQLARFVHSLARQDRLEADELLPEILSYPFWGLDRSVIWRISTTAEREGQLWLEVMREYPDQKVRSIAEFLLELSGRAHYEPLEFILDYLVGSHVPLQGQSEEELAGDESSAAAAGAGVMTSPFREYYFSRQRFQENQDQFVTFLSSLRVFMDAVREYKQGETLKLADLVTFVDLHQENDLPVIDRSPYVNAEEAVQLLTAHKAKGLEYSAVFVLSCVEEVWTSKPRGSNLPFPMNMPVMPAGDTLDDQLRLFFVALTRAKERLYLTAYRSGDRTGKESMPVQFLSADPADRGEAAPAVSKILAPETLKVDEEETPDTTEVLTASFTTAHSGPFAHEEEALLRSLVEDYQMSVTHLNNFLNVAKGGPQLFLEQNLLRFPQAKSSSGAFGSAVHKALELLLTSTRQHGSRPELERVLEWFRQALRRERLHGREYEDHRQRGEKALAAFYHQKGESLDASQMAEVNFRTQGVVVGQARLGGKIDRLVPLDKHTAEVHDYKTGKPKPRWQGRTPLEKIQLHHFRQQLAVYKILVEESKDYSRMRVDRGVLEFVEPDKNGRLIELTADITEEEVARTRRLIEAVYTKVVNLDFPNTEEYSPDLAGVERFEEELLEGRV